MMLSICRREFSPPLLTQGSGREVRKGILFKKHLSFPFLLLLKLETDHKGVVELSSSLGILSCVIIITARAAGGDLSQLFRLRPLCRGQR